MKIKKGASLRGLGPQIVVGIMIAQRVYSTYGVELVITAGSDGKHMEGSRHYTGEAVDLRIRTVPKDRRETLFTELKYCLGEGFDLVQHKTHYHMEVS